MSWFLFVLFIGLRSAAAMAFYFVLPEQFQIKQKVPQISSSNSEIYGTLFRNELSIA